MRLISTSRTKTPEVDRATAKDKSRPVLSCAYLNVEERTIEATDSYMAVVIPVEIEEGDTPGLIPSEALSALRKASKRVQHSLSANGDITLETPDGVQSWKRPEGQFPELRKIVPDEFSGFRIGINAEKLNNLAKALGAENGVVTLEFALKPGTEEGEDVGFFPHALRGMRVTAGSDAWGILMPVRVP